MGEGGGGGGGGGGSRPSYNNCHKIMGGLEPPEPPPIPTPMCGVAVDKKIICMAAKSVVLTTEDRQVVGQGCLPLSSTRSSPCSQQLALLALFTATGKRIWPIISPFHLISGMVSCYFGQRGPDNRGSTLPQVDQVRVIFFYT